MRKIFAVIPVIVAILSISFVSTTYAWATFSEGIIKGCTDSYVKGYVSADDAAGDPVYTYSRVYLEFYKDGILQGTKQDDGYAASYAETANCTHPSSSDYWMPYSIYYKTSDGEEKNIGGNSYWPH